jgi:2'-5' RNA ligase
MSPNRRRVAASSGWPSLRRDALHGALVRRFPERDATGRFAGGFTPHLSVGQARDAESLREFQRELRHWTPLAFAISSVTIIVREPPPDDIFRTFAEVPLGSGAAASRA